MDINKLLNPTLVHMQCISNQELDYRQKEFINQYLWSQTEEEEMQKEVEELRQIKEKLIIEKEQEIAALKMV